jgi:hypothetical protein
MRNLILATLILIASSSIAQEHGRHGDRPDMKEKLNLTEEQAAQFNTTTAKYKGMMAAVRSEDMEPEAKRAEMKTMREEMMAELATFLSEEQMTQFKEMSKRRMEHKKKAAHKDMKRSEEHRAMRKEMGQYRQTEIMPVLFSQRTKLDKEISKKDRKEIDVARAELKEIRAEMKAWKKEIKEKKKSGSEFKEEDKAKKEAMIAKKKEAMKGMKELAEKYKPEIDALMKEIEPQKSKWEADMKAIAQKHMGEDKPAHPKHRAKDKTKHMYGPVGFLLLDPNAKEEFEMEPMTQEVVATEVTLYPNPATTESKVELKVTEEGPITVTLIDSEGRVVKQLLDEEKAMGRHTLDVDLRDVDNGLYYISIIDNSGKQTIKLVVNKD